MLRTAIAVVAMMVVAGCVAQPVREAEPASRWKPGAQVAYSFACHSQESMVAVLETMERGEKVRPLPDCGVLPQPIPAVLVERVSPFYTVEDTLASVWRVLDVVGDTEYIAVAEADLEPVERQPKARAEEGLAI